MEPKPETPPKRFPHWLKFTLMLGVAFLMSLAILRTPSVHHHFPDLQNSKEIHQDRKGFPDLQLVDLEGVKTSLSSFRGKVVLISFWASWCAPCLEELPIFAEISRRFSEDLAVVAINQDDDASVKTFIDEFWPKYQIPFGTYYDPTHELARKVDLQVLPTNILIDRNGRLVFTSEGYNDWLGEDAQTFIRELIAEAHTP